METPQTLSRELNVPVSDVIYALMRLGLMKTVTEPLAPEEIRHVRSLLPEPPQSSGTDGDEDGVREPRRPHKPTLGGAVAMPKADELDPPADSS